MSSVSDHSIEISEIRRALLAGNIQTALWLLGELHKRLDNEKKPKDRDPYAYYCHRGPSDKYHPEDEMRLEFDDDGKLLPKKP